MSSMIDNTDYAIRQLENGEVPVYLHVMYPREPTPLYWRTVMATGVQPSEDDERPSMQVQQHLGLARLPIPARPLSYQARARRTDPETSHQAAASVRKISDTHRRIVVMLQRHPEGMTDEGMYRWWMAYREAQGWPSITPSGLRTRRSELQRRGDIVAADEKGRTAAGRACTIWTLADA